MEILELKRIPPQCLVLQVLLTLLLLKRLNLKQNQQRYLDRALVVVLPVLEEPCHLVVLLLDQLEVLANLLKSHPILSVQIRQHNPHQVGLAKTKLNKLQQGLDKAKLLLRQLKVLVWARHLKGQNPEALEDLVA